MGEYPPRHATDDEFGNMWSGLNFWDSGTPSSWSGLKGANHIGMALFEERGYYMVRPVFDHPPLFQLLSGGAAWFTNPEKIVQQTPEGNRLVVWDVNLSRARWMMIPLFIASFWLLYGIASLAFGPGAAVLTVLFYGLMSHAVAQGRLIMADNLSTMLLLAGVWSIQAWHCGKLSRRWMAALVMATTAGAVLTKVPAWCQVPALIAMLMAVRRAREVWFVVAGFAIGAALYFAWVCWFGLADFVAVMGSQADRFRGFNAFQLLSGVPRLLDVRDLNGVVIAGWFCVLAQALRPGAKAVMLVLPVYVMAFTFFAGDVLFGWYSLPMFPFLALALGLTTQQVWRRPHAVPAMAWLLLFLPHCFQTIFVSRFDLKEPLRYSFVAVLAVLVFAYALPRPRAIRVFRMAMIPILALVLMREVYEVTNQRRDRITDQEKYLG